MTTYGNTIASDNALAIVGDVHNLQVSRHGLEISFFKTSAYEQAKDTYESRVQNTCSWFLEHQKYKSWKSAKCSSIFWLEAGPGLGKSVLSKALVEERLVAQGKQDTVLYYFFKDNGDQTPFCTALCAMLHQLYCCPGGDAIFKKHAVPAIKRNGDWLKKNNLALLQLFIQSTQEVTSGTIYCILDALDEAHKSARAEVPRFLDRVAMLSTNSGQPSLKCFITSRTNVAMENALFALVKDHPDRKLVADEESLSISEDIDRVAKAKILDLSAHRNLTAREQQAIQEKVSSSSDRTYLWLSLVWPHIESASGLSEDEYIANVSTMELPKKLESIYRNMLNQCSDIVKAQRVLSLIIASHQTLTLTELDALLAVSTQTRSFKDLQLRGRTRLAQEIRRLCGPIVIIVGEKPQLIHHSAKSFLVRSWPSALCNSNESSGPVSTGQKNALSHLHCLRDLVQKMTLLLRLNELNQASLTCLNIISPFIPREREWIEQQRNRIDRHYPGLLYAVDNWLTESQTLSELECKDRASYQPENNGSEICWISYSNFAPSFVVQDFRQWWLCSCIPRIYSKPSCANVSMATYSVSPIWFGLSLMLDGKIRGAFQDEIELIQSQALSTADLDQRSPIESWEISLLVAAASGVVVDSMSHIFYHARKSTRFQIVGNAALRLTTMFSHHKLMKALLQAGASPNVPGPGGHTAVHVALDPCIHTRQNFSRFETLMRYGVLDFDVVNGEYLTPLAYVDSPEDLEYLNQIRTANWRRLDQLVGRFRVELWTLMVSSALLQQFFASLSSSISLSLLCIECIFAILLILLCPSTLPRFKSQQLAFLAARKRMSGFVTSSARSEFLDYRYGLAETSWKEMLMHQSLRLLRLFSFYAERWEQRLIDLFIRFPAREWEIFQRFLVFSSWFSCVYSVILLIQLPMQNASQKGHPALFIWLLVAIVTPLTTIHVHSQSHYPALFNLLCGTVLAVAPFQYSQVDELQTRLRTARPHFYQSLLAGIIHNSLFVRYAPVSYSGKFDDMILVFFLLVAAGIEISCFL